MNRHGEVFGGHVARRAGDVAAEVAGIQQAGKSEIRDARDAALEHHIAWLQITVGQSIRVKVRQSGENPPCDVHGGPVCGRLSAVFG